MSVTFNHNLVQHLLKFVDHDCIPETLKVSIEFYEKTLCNSGISQDALVYYCAHNRDFEVKCLLKNPHIDPTINHNEPLVTACANGSLKCVQLLCEDSRVNPSHKWNCPLISACEKGQMLVVKYLLDVQKVNVADQNNKAFRWACLMGNHETVEYLLTRKDVDPIDGRLEIIENIVQKGDWQMYYLLVRNDRIRNWLSSNRPRMLDYTDGHYQ